MVKHDYIKVRECQCGCLVIMGQVMSGGKLHTVEHLVLSTCSSLKHDYETRTPQQEDAR